MKDIEARGALDQLTVSVETAGKLFGLGKSGAYAAVHSGHIPSIRMGGRYVVPTAPLRKMLGLETEAA